MVSARLGRIDFLTFSMAIFQGAQGSVQTLSFYVLTILYLIGIAAAYVAVYWTLGERVFAASNPWVNTVILVLPAAMIAWRNVAILPFAGLAISDSLSLAMSVYIGVSFILQWRIKYGGCEVVALPILLVKRSYTTYCVPLVALDAVEKQVTQRRP